MIQRFEVGKRLSEMAVHNGTVYLAGQIADGPAEQRRVHGEPVQLRQLEVVMAGAKNHEHDPESYR